MAGHGNQIDVLPLSHLVNDPGGGTFFDDNGIHLDTLLLKSPLRLCR